MKTYYFTFGFGQVHENGFHKIEAKDYASARKEMVDKFGLKWAFQYEENQWFDENGLSQEEKYNLHEVK